MSIKINNKLCSACGASFSMALLLLLVCTVVSSIVLAASTSMVGVVSQQGESDQRYYSVSSATGLLTYWMGDDKEVKLTGMQSKSLDDDVSVDVTMELDSESNKQGTAFDELLTVATEYALFGTSDLESAKAELSSLGEDKWLEPFKCGDWGTSLLGDSLSLNSTITPKGDTVRSGSGFFDLVVEVEGKLTTNWELYLVFKNAVESEDPDTDQYPILVTLHGNAGTFPRDIEGENKLSRESIVTWSIAGIEPGKGMP